MGCYGRNRANWQGVWLHIPKVHLPEQLGSSHHPKCQLWELATSCASPRSYLREFCLSIVPKGQPLGSLAGLNPTLGKADSL